MDTCTLLVSITHTELNHTHGLKLLNNINRLFYFLILYDYAVHLNMDNVACALIEALKSGATFYKLQHFCGVVLFHIQQ